MSNGVPDIVVQYSPDNSTWYSGWEQGYSYIRISADGGDTYYINMYYTGEEEPAIQKQYSDNAVDWSIYAFSRYYFVRFSVDGGLSWSAGVRYKDVHAKEQYGENVVIQYSENGSTWKDNYSNGARYIRFWLDYGEFCTEKFAYNGTGTAQLAVVFSPDGRMMVTSFSKYSSYFVRFSADGGLSWSGMIRLRDYEYRYQYSDSKTGLFHDEYTEKDIYTRYTEDNGETWSDPYIFVRDNSKPFNYRVLLSDVGTAYNYDYSGADTIIGNIGLLALTETTKTTCKKFNSEDNFTVDTYTFYCESVSWDYVSWRDEVQSGHEITHKRDETGDGSIGNPWKNLGYALEQIECLFSSTCDKNYKIIVTGTVDYPVGINRVISHRGSHYLVNVGSFDEAYPRVGVPLFLDMTNADIHFDLNKDITWSNKLFNGRYIVIGAKIKMSGKHLRCIGEGSIWNDCSIQLDFSTDYSILHVALLLNRCECVSCDVEIEVSSRQHWYNSLICFENCKCLSCNVNVDYNKIPYTDEPDWNENGFERKYSTTGFHYSVCEKCRVDGAHRGFHNLPQQAEVLELSKENVSAGCFYGFYSGKEWNNCIAINCVHGYWLMNENSIYNNCKAVITNDYKDTFFSIMFASVMLSQFDRSVLYFATGEFINCTVEINYTFKGWGPYRVYAFDVDFSVLSGCSVNVLLDSPQQTSDEYEYHLDVHLVGFGGGGNIMSSCSFIGEIRGDVGDTTIIPAYFNMNTIENFSYTCLPRCAVEPE